MTNLEKFRVVDGYRLDVEATDKLGHKMYYGIYAGYDDGELVKIGRTAASFEQARTAKIGAKKLAEKWKEEQKKSNANASLIPAAP